MGALDDLFEQTEDQPLPGGCELCDAYQTLTVIAPGVYGMAIAHEDWCPVLHTN